MLKKMRVKMRAFVKCARARVEACDIDKDLQKMLYLSVPPLVCRSVHRIVGLSVGSCVRPSAPSYFETTKSIFCFLMTTKLYKHHELVHLSVGLFVQAVGPSVCPCVGCYFKVTKNEDFERKRVQMTYCK